MNDIGFPRMNKWEKLTEERIRPTIERLGDRLQLCAGLMLLQNFALDDQDESETMQRLSDELFQIAVIAQDASKAIMEARD